MPAVRNAGYRDSSQGVPRSLVAYRLHDQTDAESEENHHCKDFAKEPLIRHRMAFAEQIRKKMSQEKRDQLTYCHQYTDSRQKLFIHFIDQRSLTLHRAKISRDIPATMSRFSTQFIHYSLYHAFSLLIIPLHLTYSQIARYTCFLAALLLILLICGAVTLFESPENKKI